VTDTWPWPGDLDADGGRLTGHLVVALELGEDLRVEHAAVDLLERAAGRFVGNPRRLAGSRSCGWEPGPHDGWNAERAPKVS
jgi:hypothetical protein